MSRALAMAKRLRVPRGLRSAPRFVRPQTPAWWKAMRTEAGRESMDEEVAAAWTQLREHPALSWVPPMWRTTAPVTGRSRYAVSALERNLVIEIVRGSEHGMQVRLMTGPLEDRRVGDGVDPMTPAASRDPKLTVCAPTFEKAVLQLRDAVVDAYGEAELRRPSASAL